MAGNLIPGAGMVQNLLEGLTSQIAEIVDKSINEKMDAVLYEVIKPQIAEQMESIFKSAPVQMAASDMFTRELFPIYERTLKDFANFNSLVKGVDADIKTKIIAFVKEYIESKTDAERNAAIEKFIGELKGISDKKVGKMLEMKGGDLQSFLGNVNNKFKVIEGGTPAPKYLSDGTNLISQAIEEIVGGLKNTREEFKKTIDESTKNNREHGIERRKAMRKPKPKFNINKITESLGNQANNAVAEIGNKATGIKISGGKSKRRKPKRQNKTYKKRR